MAHPTSYHEDSDADDEYERGLFSPQTAEFERSPSTSEPPSTEPTPTHNKFDFDDELTPGNLMTDWSCERCVNWLNSIGLTQYQDSFLENEVDGEALVALRHDELKEMGVVSMGHRLTILKNVYDLKMRQELAIEPEHYVPLTADSDAEHMNAKQSDIQAIIRSIQMRDERIIQAELDLRKMTEEYKKLREELLPVFRMAKDRSQPLPTSPSWPVGGHYGKPFGAEPEIEGPPTPIAQQATGAFMKRQVKKPSLKLNKDTAKIPSPTNLPPTIPEERSPINGPMSNGPSTGAPHLTASNAVRPPTSHSYRNSPSPTSPSYAPSTHTLNEQSNDHTSRNYHDSSRFSTSTVTPSDSSRAHASSTSSRAPNHPMTNIPINNGSTLSLPDPPNSATSSTTPSAEIFKSFRVSKEDPCYKVLPAALKRYNIDADPGCYALYIVHGDQERCLGREERPLLLFKKLAEEGRKPMFMLRKHNSPVHGYSTTTLNPGSEGGAPPTGKPGFALPGGVI